MYAVIKTGGKQYRVTPGNVLKVETLNAEVGTTVNFEEILMIVDGDNITIGNPTIASAKVAAEVIAHGRAKKVEIVKFRRRKHHQKRTGHRQNFTQIQIQNINGKGAIAKKVSTKTADDDTKPAAKKVATKTSAKPATKASTAENKPAVKKATSKPAVKKSTATKAATTKKKPATKKATSKPAAKKSTAKKATTKTSAKPATKASTAENKPAAKKATSKPAVKKSTAKKSTAADNLTKIEGIGPKAAEALNTAGINSYAELAKTKVPAVQKILDAADGKFGAMKPDTWPKQAKLAADDKWDELKKWQDEMQGGIEKK